MPQFELRHDLKQYAEFVKPNFIKKINNNLSLSLSYLERADSETECLLSFHNTLNEHIVISPQTDEHERRNPESKGWFSSIFGSGEDETQEREEEERDEGTPSSEIKILLGYIQLFGYVLLNYKFRLEESSNPIDSYSDRSSWWVNKEYASHYQDNETTGDEEDIEYNLNRVPFIQRNLKNRMVIGGRLGGVNDLVINDSQANSSILSKHDPKTIDENDRYLLQDLLFPFGSINAPETINDSSDKNKDSKGVLSLKELTDSIIPFYTTSQFLLFSDLNLESRSTKTFHIKFPKVSGLSPSYNTRMTRPVCDQGWVSIKYLLIVGLLQMSRQNHEMKSYNIYFPLEVEGERQGTHERWLQQDFLKETKIDQDWKVTICDDSRFCSDLVDSGSEDSREGRDTFLHDLSTLIDSDLYNMPKISTNERKKSVPNMHDTTETIEPGLIPQLPNHLKTQYQIRVNEHDLCLLSISKPYFHIGEDAYFVIDSNPKGISRTRIAGLIVHLETHETFHTELEEGKITDYKNIYKVSSSIKYNTFASAITNSKFGSNNAAPSLIHGMINIPKFLTQQFQSSELMEIKHYLVFKFNLNDFEETSENIVTESSENQDTSVEQDLNENVSRKSLQNEDTNRLTDQDKYLDTFQDYKFDNYGGELRFRLPITVLP